jgi:aspartokinase-like uncharacterized kinase
MESLSTGPYPNEFNTATADESVTKHKNQKVIGLLCSRMLRSKDSCISLGWRTTEDYLSFSVASPDLPQAHHTISVLDKSTEEIISTYKNENIVHNLNINHLFVREYTHHIPVKLLHLLVDAGKEIFKDARPRNEVEAKIVNDFVRSKSKVLFSKKL